MTFKGAIFDFNGTLFWDTAFHNRAFNIFLEKYGIKLSDNEKRIKIHGKPNADIMRGIFGNHLTDSEIHELAQEKEAIYRNLCINDLQFAPGAEGLIIYLSAKRIPITIATSAGIENVSFYFENMHLGRWFNFDKIVFDTGTFRGKPAPDVFLLAAEKLGLQTKNTIIFEDSVPGILAAETSGAGKIYIVNSYGENYSQFSHDIITHFDQVDRNLFD
jgi:HAD superfamily hydrolase (TIGR01509 family)